MLRPLPYVIPISCVSLCIAVEPFEGLAPASISPLGPDDHKPASPAPGPVNYIHCHEYNHPTCVNHVDDVMLLYDVIMLGGSAMGMRQTQHVSKMCAWYLPLLGSNPLQDMYIATVKYW